MGATAVSTRQIAAIHTLSKALGLPEDLRRDIIAVEAGGKRSTSELTFAEAGRVIERLKGEQAKTSPAANVPTPAGAVRMDGPYAAKLRALWISAWNLGLVHDNTDRALCAFIERQTKISHPRFLRESHEAAKAIEGLKAWMRRDAGVKWPPPGSDIADVKLAVIDAQCARIEQLRLTPIRSLVATDFDEVAASLGFQLRKALKTKGGAA
jgi:hypothetical protein